MEPCCCPWRGKQSFSRGRGEICRSSPENGAWHTARWVTGTPRLKAGFNICLGYGVSYNGGFSLCHHASRQWLNAHESNLCSSRGARGGTGSCTDTLLHRHSPAFTSRCHLRGDRGGQGRQEPGHSSQAGLCRCSLLHLPRAGLGTGRGGTLDGDVHRNPSRWRCVAWEHMLGP